MLGSVLSGAAKGLLKKPKKVDPNKFAGKMENAKADSKPKGGALALRPTESIVKVVDIKPNEGKVNAKGGPLAEIQEGVHSIVLALSNESKAKKKRLKVKRKNQEKKWRSFLESLSEIGKVGGAIGGAIASKAGVGNLLSNIWKTIGILFVGWMMNYLPKIITFIQKFVDVVGKIVKFVEPIVKALWATMVWITDKGTKLFAMLIGVEPDEALNNSIIKNFTEIQKRIPLIEAIFATFAVLKAKSVIGGNRTNRTNTKSRTSNVKPKTSKTTIKTSTKDSKLIRSRHGTNAQRIYDNARQNGKTIPQSNAAVNKALKRGQIISKPDSGLSSLGKSKGKILKHGLKRSVKRGAIKLLGKGAVKTVGKLFGRIPIVGSLIVAISQLLAGEPLGKALFMGVGAGLGGLLGSFIPIPVVGTLLGEGIGMFIGELLYEGMMGKGWGAAGKKLKDTLMGIITGAGKIGQAFIKWLFGGGLAGMLGNAGKAIANWFKTGASNFINNFPEIPIPAITFASLLSGPLEKMLGGMYTMNVIPTVDFKKGDDSKAWYDPRRHTGGASVGLTSIKNLIEKMDYGLQDILGTIFNVIPGLSRLVEGGKVDGIPNLGLLAFPPLLIPHLIKSFFPKAPGSESGTTGPVAKKNILGITMSDEHQSDEYLQQRDGGELQTDLEPSRAASQEKEQTASSISESASYDKQDGKVSSGIIPVPVNQMQTGTSGGSSGGASSSGVNKYDAVSDFKKTMVLAKLYPG